MYILEILLTAFLSQIADMADYFSEYATFVGVKGLPSPADTPYETPGFIRSMRSSRAIGSGSREQSASPPPLPPDTTDYNEKTRDGRYSALDPRRFTPTLHASLVSEILNLRRELDSKNHLVENLETTLSTTKTDNETLSEQLSQHAREVRKAKQQVQQMEQGAYEAVQALVKERDVARYDAEELQCKLEAATKKTRWQDEDAVQTQNMWENEKESWENERRQLERRIHVTETRLRTFVDEVSLQQAMADAQVLLAEETGDEGTFKDSGFGNESDTASLRSAISVTPVKHRRNMSSLSYRARSIRNSISSRTSMGTPDLQARPNGYSLADELGIDEEDEFDMDEFEHADDELEYPEPKRRTAIHSRHGSVEVDSKAKRVLGLTTDIPDSPMTTPMRSPTRREMAKHSTDLPVVPEFSRLSTYEASPVAVAPQQAEAVPAKRVEYKDTGYQPSPPPSPKSKGTLTEPMQIPQIQAPESEVDLDTAIPKMAQAQAAKRALQVATRVAASPISPPETPVVDGISWPGSRPSSVFALLYSAASTQTDFPEPKPTRPNSMRSNRDSLSPPMFVPSIAIHPPSSRPASPRSYVLPPGTKNASAQANLPWPSRDAEVQTEEIRIDQRLRRLPSNLFPPQRQSSLLRPSPSFTEPAPPPKRTSTNALANILTKIYVAPSLPSPPLQSPVDSSPERSKDTRNLPLRAIQLPRPVLAPAQVSKEKPKNGPLNRSSQYGVTSSLQGVSQLLDIDKDSDDSDYEDPSSDVDFQDMTGSISAFGRAPQGRFGLSEPPKVVFEHMEIAPDRRPDTADSYGAAPAPSISSGRATSNRVQSRPFAKINAYKDVRSRSPSLGSIASDSYSTQSAMAPPFAIPTRSSSRFMPQAHSEGSQSPTPYKGTDTTGRGGHRFNRTDHVRQNSLRKVQSAAVIRQSARARSSPQKGRRRHRSPNLTPIQSMAFDNIPTPTRFPIPELPTPLQEWHGFDLVKGSTDLGIRPSTAGTAQWSTSEETSLVNAIAATMVGEWMWKYIRKRKSFGITEDTPEYSKDSSNTHGTRHRRWVWLSPYERTIMWDTKQPTSGTALLGKKGRKCKRFFAFTAEM